MKFEVKALIKVPHPPRWAWHPARWRSKDNHQKIYETPSLVIEADNEWMARTIYMAKSNLKLSGEFVDWSIKQV